MRLNKLFYAWFWIRKLNEMKSQIFVKLELHQSDSESRHNWGMHWRYNELSWIEAVWLISWIWFKSGLKFCFENRGGILLILIEQAQVVMVSCCIDVSLEAHWRLCGIIGVIGCRIFWCFWYVMRLVEYLCLTHHWQLF